MNKIRLLLRLFYILRLTYSSRKLLASVSKELYNQEGDLSDYAVKLLYVYSLMNKFLFEEPIEELNKDINELKKILKS
jgi:hypothetical protein